MLFIQELQLKDFFSHEKTTIKFKPEQKLLIDGKSGAGKSSIVEALVWVLYGKARVDNRSLIRHGESSAKVVIILEDDKTNVIYKIERSVDSKGKNSLKISEKTKAGTYLPIKVTGLKVMQEHLEKELLKSSYLLFINSIAYPQDNLENFVKQTASKRKDIILEIANVSSYDAYYEKAKSELSNQTSLVGRDEAIIVQLKESIEKDKKVSEPIDSLANTKTQLEGEIEIEKKKISKMQATQATIDSMAQQLISKKNELDSLQSDTLLLTNKIADANQKLIKLDDSEIKKIEEEISDLEQYRIDVEKLKENENKVNVWNTEMLKLVSARPVDIGYEKIITEINRQIIEVMGRKVLMCPELNRECPHFAKERDERAKQLENLLEEKTIDFDAYKKAIDEHGKKVAALGDCPESKSAEIKTMETIIYSKEQKRILLEKLKSEKNSNEKLLENIIVESQERIDINNKKNLTLSKEYTELKELVDKTPSMSSEITMLEVTLSSLQAQYNTALQNLAVAENALLRVQEDEIKLKKLQENIVGTIEKIESLKLLKDAFGQNGIKAIVIDYIIPRLEDRINDILSKLSDFRIHLNTQKSGVSEDTVLEGLFINIFNESGLEFPFDNYSGGERLKIIVAISEALAEIQNIGFRILDELFIGLDEESTDKFAEVMTTLQERFKQLFCISHLKNIKDMFDNKLEIVKLNGVSQIA